MKAKQIGLTVKDLIKILKRVKNKNRIVVCNDELGFRLEPVYHVFEEEVEIGGKLENVISIRAKLSEDFK